MSLTFKHINAEEQIFDGSITPSLFAPNILVSSLNADSSPALTGAIQLVSGANIMLSQSGNVITITAGESGTVAWGSITGTLSSQTDLQTALNGKQSIGNYITALTGDGIASGPGSSTLTLATVNSNVGSFTNANITVNAKGLITAASNGSAGGVTGIKTTGGSTETGLITLAAGTNVTIIDSPAGTFTINSSAGTPDLTDNHIFVGNASNVATDVAMSGDATIVASGALTLATVNSDIGTFTYPSITVNAKGLITAISNGTAPVVYTAGTGLTLTGTAFSVNVDNSTLDISGGNLEVKSGGITNNQINASAAISYSKLSLTGDIHATDIAAGQVVKSINTLTDSVTLAAGSNITLTPSGHTITIASTASFPSITSTVNPNNVPDNGETPVPLGLATNITLSDSSHLVSLQACWLALFNGEGGFAMDYDLYRDGSLLRDHVTSIFSATIGTSQGTSIIFVDAPGDTATHTYEIYGTYQGTPGSNNLSFSYACMTLSEMVAA